MDDGASVLVLFMTWIFGGGICGCIAGAIADTKCRSFGGWFLLGFFFGPLAILAVAVTSPIRSGEASYAAATSASLTSPSIADELTKLADLRDRGVLSQTEFDEQKTKLLA